MRTRNIYIYIYIYQIMEKETGIKQITINIFPAYFTKNIYTNITKIYILIHINI